MVRRESDVLAAELRRRVPRQAAAGGTNQLDGALVDAKFCVTKRKAGYRNKDELRAKRYAQLQWNQNNPSHFDFFYTTLSCNLQSTSTSKTNITGSATAAPGPHLASN